MSSPASLASALRVHTSACQTVKLASRAHQAIVCAVSCRATAASRLYKTAAVAHLTARQRRMPAAASPLLSSRSHNSYTTLTSAQSHTLSQPARSMATTTTKAKEVAAPKGDNITTAAATATQQTTSTAHTERQHRDLLDGTLTRRFFYVPSFEIHGGVAGLYDFGPPGCALKDNLTAYWRRHFVLEEAMLEIGCAVMTPHVVLQTSGHVDRFTDYMVRDTKNTDLVYRADKLLEEVIDKKLEELEVGKLQLSATEKDELLTIRSAAGAYNQQQLSEAFQRFKIVSPETQNPLTEPFAFNLMFVTQIGPTGKLTGYLRPETAQGMFVNFRRLLDYNNGKMPFAAAQIGLAFRNEIAPRSGLLRVREFSLAEIEHFVHPTEKQHPRFNEVTDITISLLPREDQHGEEIPRRLTVKQSVDQGVVDNETLAYYLARTHLFLLSVGIKEDRLRFRQHKANEMAHYAADCWDAEIYMNSFGWIEVVGHADRSAYDLKVHSDKSKVELTAHKLYEPPVMQEVATVKPNFAAIGKQYGKQGQVLIKHLKELSKDDALKLQHQLKSEDKVQYPLDGTTYELSKSTVDITVETKKISSEKYIPNVIEPAFGLGRILYGILDHSFYIRKGTTDQRAVLGVPTLMSPIKVALLPLSNNEKFDPFVKQLNRQLTAANISSKIDSSGVSIGKRYARADEIGTAYAITIDFDTVEQSDSNPMTIRERDSTQQIRVPFKQAVTIVRDLLDNTLTWQTAYDKYEKVIRDETAEKDE